MGNNNNYNRHHNRGMLRCRPLRFRTLQITRAVATAVVVSPSLFSRYLGNLIRGAVKGIVKGIKGLMGSHNTQPGTANSPNNSMISPPITPMSSGGPMSPGMSTPPTPQHHGSPSPTSFQDPNANGGEDLDYDLHGDPNQDPAMTPNHHPTPIPNGGGPPVPIQAQLSIHVGSGGHGNWDPHDPDVCRLQGCSNPVYVDPVSHRKSEYCSQRHRE